MNLLVKPGLVGGHCISVDPYYLTYKSMKSGYTPKFILSGRKINDNMPKYIVSEIEKINKKNKKINFQITFKENCSDYRNSLSLQMYRLLKESIRLIYMTLIMKMSLYHRIYSLKNLKT